MSRASAAALRARGETREEPRQRGGARRRSLACGVASVLAVGAAMGVATAGGPGAASAPPSGGEAVVALIQEPGAMSPFFNDQSGSDLAFAFVLEPLFVPLADGTFEPVLAAEVPTVENGGVSEDGLTVTYRMQEGITWSDGTELTADDLLFTFEVFSDPESTPLVGAEWGLVETVTVIDPLTIEVQMTEPNPGYLLLWDQILPEHQFESTAVTNEHPEARLPLGTGPFVFAEWETGDQITLERNPAYWRDPALPRLDGVTVKIVPDDQVAMNSFLNGEFDTVYFFTSGNLPDLNAAAEEGAPIEVALQETPSWVEWLWLNHSDNGDPETPHPVLGDPAIREAIDHGVDRQAVIDEVLSGYGTQVGSVLYAGAFAVDVPVTPYDPEHAVEVLDAAGWVPGDDGIREKDGVRASLRYQTVSGDQVRALYQQVVQQNLADIGIEVVIENVPSNIIFGEFGEGGLLATGDFDMMMSRDGYYIDPVDWISVFGCASIPNADAPAGFTYSHWCNEEFDALAADAASTLDVEQRQELYQQIAEMFAAERVAIPLYSSTWGWAWNQRLNGVDTSFWDGMWESVGAAEWYLDE